MALSSVLAPTSDEATPGDDTPDEVTPDDATPFEDTPDGATPDDATHEATSMTGSTPTPDEAPDKVVTLEMTICSFALHLVESQSELFSLLWELRYVIARGHTC